MPDTRPAESISKNSVPLAKTGTATIVSDLLIDLQQAAEDIVPRFLSKMPEAYFLNTDQTIRLSHIKAIIAAEAGGLSQTMTLRDEDGNHYTFISDTSYPGQLSEFVRRLPREKPLDSAKVYTATDSSLVLDVFDFGNHEPDDINNPDRISKVAHLCETILKDESQFSEDRLNGFLKTCSYDYLLRTPPAQICKQLRIVERISNQGNSFVQLKNHPKDSFTTISIGVNNVDRRLLFERMTLYLGHRAVDIQGAYLDSFDQGNGEIVSLLKFMIACTGKALQPYSGFWEQLETDLKRLIYLDETLLEFAAQMPVFNVLHAEILTALSHLIHQKLVRREPLIFSRERISRTLLRYNQIALELAELFVSRFKKQGDPEFEKKFEALAEYLCRDVDNQAERDILHTLLQAIKATLRTNLFEPDRFALVLRIDPDFLKGAGREESPFGVFYVYGRGFDGFHVRFRDISRGGVRIVRPLGQEQYALETERLYDEVYGLAHAQQLKNKDIPEGGSKGVILARPDANMERVGRYYADALLDLLVTPPQDEVPRVDYYGQDELLYLGPDENISNRLITWVVDRARQRGHPMPGAFMSSKPGAGINHKAYGVTSEGVTVFLEAALRARGIDPRQQTFTLKMAGGPDGDVAGNEIKILYREYGDNARILGIADGSGCIEDPEGLDSGELLRLVEAELPVSDFDPHSLGESGRLLTIDEPGGIQARNTLHNRLITDVFIPAGGRPRTVSSENWQDFMKEPSVPSSRIIVEGANLYITPEAREQLSRQGVMVIKDSSANKCGVICSSFEIVASMLLDESDFLKIKDQFVQQVLEKLRKLAALEARILLREQRHKPDATLPKLSVRLSHAINRATDAITHAIDTLKDSDHQLTRQLVRDHLPAVLSELVGKHIFERIPAAYLTRIIASGLASRIVYREGLDWFEQMSDEAIADSAIRYLRAEHTVQQLVGQIHQTAMPDKKQIADLLTEGGVAAFLRNTSD